VSLMAVGPSFLASVTVDICAVLVHSLQD